MHGSRNQQMPTYNGFWNDGMILEEWNDAVNLFIFSQGPLEDACPDEALEIV